MPIGLSFSVRIDPSAARINTAAANQSHYLIIDNPITNENPYATVIVTPVSSGVRRMTHPFAVGYVAPHWQILFTDAAAMPPTDRTVRPGSLSRLSPPRSTWMTRTPLTRRSFAERTWQTDQALI